MIAKEGESLRISTSEKDPDTLLEVCDDETIQIDAHIKGQLVSGNVVDSGSGVNTL